MIQEDADGNIDPAPAAAIGEGGNLVNGCVFPKRSGMLYISDNQPSAVAIQAGNSEAAASGPLRTMVRSSTLLRKQGEQVHPDRVLRWASPDDYGGLADIMFDAVRNGESRYSERQREAWVPARRSGADWTARLQSEDIVVAEQGGRPVGFMSLADGGYVDFAYIRPEAQHTGLFRQLMTRIIERAVARREPLLWTHASLMAEPAFASHGFIVRRRERVTIGGESFDRCEMEKRLETSAEIEGRTSAFQP